MKPNLLKLTKFYEKNLSNNNLFCKQGVWVLFYALFAVSLFIISQFMSEVAWIGLIVFGLAAITMVFNGIVVYKIERQLGELTNLSFKEKLGRCMETIQDTKCLLFIGDAESVKQERMNRVGEYLKKEGMYNKNCIEVYLEVLENEYENHYSSTSRFTFLIGFLVPIWAIFIQILLNPNNISSNELENFALLKGVIFSLMIYMFWNYVLVMLCAYIIKSAASFFIPTKKSNMLDLINVLRELYTGFAIVEIQDNIENNRCRDKEMLFSS